MYKYLLQNENLNWLAVIALVLFFAVFVGFTFWILTRKKEYIDKMSALPLEEDE